jgi:hypothetical protein
MPATGGRSASPGAPKKKTKAQLEREHWEQEMMQRLIDGGMDADAIAKVLNSPDDKEKEEVDLGKKFASTVMSCAQDLDKPFHFCVLAGMIYVLYGNPDGAWLAIFWFCFVAGFTIHYTFDKKNALRPTMVMFSYLLMFFALYGISTQEHFKTEESFNKRLRSEDAAETLSICYKAIQAELESLKNPKIKKTVWGFEGILF